MNFVLKKAERKNVKMRIGFWGAAGSGKTFSSLRFAKGFIGDWSKIAVIDTENGSAELYSHLGPFLHVNFPPPFSPERYIEAIQYVGSQKNIELIIIDSISHEWEGPGGCLQLADGFKNKQQGWGHVTLLHNDFTQAIVQSPCHVLFCGRTKVDYDLGKDDRNKGRGQKIGTKLVTREGFDYEMTIAFKLTESHYAEIDKDRTDLFKEHQQILITEDTGQMVKKWNDSGKQYLQMSSTAIEIFACLKILTNNYQDIEVKDSLAAKHGTGKEIIALSEDRQEIILGELKQLIAEGEAEVSKKEAVNE